MPDRPNILFITSDQQHWNTLSATNPEIKTPNIDSLVREGVTFTRAYCANHTCTPSRASIITGRYPSQHGAWSLGTKLPESEHTVGEDLQEVGYRTALVGKAHFQPTRSTEEYRSLESMPILQDLDFWRGFHGPFYGFEHVELIRNHTDEHLVGQHYAIWMEEKGFSNWRDYYRKPTGNAGRQLHKWPIPEEFHYDAWIAERTNALLEEYARKGESFFLWPSFPDPHPSYLVPEPWDTMYDPSKLTVPRVTEGEHEKNPPHYGMTQQEKPDFSAYREPGGAGCHGFGSHLRDRESLAKDIAVYYGMISLMDKYIGRILGKVDELGLAGNTLVIFTTDHGHMFGQHGLIAKGAFNYEDMLRIPMVARLPGRIAPGSESHALQHHVDYAPTWLSFCGVPIPRCMTGVDQKAVWLGEEGKARDHVVVENRHQPTTVFSKTFINDRYKLSVWYNQPYGELFDLKEDPGEVENLWDDPAAQDLKAELVTKLLFAEMGKEPLWMPRISGA